MGGVPNNDTRDYITQIIDRSITVNTINSVTSSVRTKGSKNVQLVARFGAITTTAPVFTIEGSLDGSNWYSVGSTLTAVASSNVQVIAANINAELIRVRVSTAGNGATLGDLTVRTF
jgi:hypothetical protein